MAVQGPFKVAFGDVFPYGAFVKGGVEPVRDFDRSSRENFVQGRDKDTGELRRPHHIDLKTGMYRGRQVLKAKTEQE